jgi:hypothetical protein
MQSLSLLPRQSENELRWLCESGSGPSVWTGRALQAESDDLEVVGLALLYPALERNVCVLGHHGYPRALDLIRVSAPKAIRAT